MFRNLLSLSCVGLIMGCLLPASTACAADRTAAERGRDILFHQALNPGIWSVKAYDEVWKQWGVPARPADYQQAFMERYGLLPAPFANAGRPLGLLEAPGLFGKGLVNSCLLCHAGRVAGQTIIGLANASLDMQSLFEEMSLANGFRIPVPFQLSYVRGTIDPVNPSTYLVQFRDSELNLQQAAKLPFSRDVCSDPPAWWLLKRKKTRDWTGLISASSTRVDMVNLLTPFNSAEYIKKQEPAFADIGAFLLTVEAPPYPFAIDTRLAARGEVLFGETCARCHGTYGPERKYPDKVVPLETIGTDPLLAEALKEELAERFNKSWFAREIGPDGKPIQVTHQRGYQAPPLDGVWATAPYFHNGSIPTIYDALNSKARPRIYTRSYRTDQAEYDQAKLGWKITLLDQSPGPNLSNYERRKIYDTTRPGQSNRGHTFGDALTEEERMAVIEYLKTL